MKSRIQHTLLALALLSTFTTFYVAQPSTAFAAPLGTAFTYQGKLTDGASPASGNYDLRFTIYDALTNGTLKAVVTNASVAVTNGLFTTPVDFGLPPLNFNAMWLEIGVRTNGSAGDFTTVSPRQAMLPAPYAFYALNSSNAVTAGVASNLLGVLPGAQLAGAYSSALTFSNAGNYFTGTFNGNGAGLMNLNAANITIGTLADTELSANVALLNSSPHFTGSVKSDSYFTGSGLNMGVQNSLTSSSGSIDGGTLNTNAAEYAVIVGGIGNTVQSGAPSSIVGGGNGNSIQVGAIGAVIAGGVGNTIATNAQDAVVPGGTGNTAGGTASFAAGTQANALHASTFVWADASGGNFASTTNNQFLIRAANGVGINTNNPGGAALNVNGAIVATNFIGSGAGLININATNLATGTVADARLAGNVARTNQVWLLNGNSGTTAGVNYLGTTDNQPLELRVNGQRALRIVPTTDTPNIIGGCSNNIIAANIVGATIGGGGTVLGTQPNIITNGGQYGTIAGGYNNTVTNYGGAVLGGSVNLAGGSFAAVGAGQFNSSLGDYTFLGGGYTNFIQTSAGYSFLGGGYGNSIQTGDGASFLGGGNGNSIRTYANFTFLGGGDGNSIQTGADHAFLGGGYGNSIQTNADHAFLGGGNGNSIQTGSADTFLGGGDGNRIQDGALYATLGGGFGNVIQDNAFCATIGGGDANSIQASFATIAGGYDNVAGSSGTFIGGGATNAVGGAYGTIDGGANNTIIWGSPFNIIAGGQYNSIEDECSYSAISGGVSNTMQEGDLYCAIGGGINNTIGTGFIGATIAGGSGNACSFSPKFPTVGGGQNNSSGGNYATVPGGDQNNASGANSFAAGHRAKANSQGDFVWADSTEADFASTGNNQFLIRAAGGVGINKTNPATALDVSGSITASGRLGIGNSAPAFQIDVTAQQAVARFTTTNNINGSVLVLDNTTPGLTYHGAVNFNDGAGQIGYLSSGAMTFTTSSGERMRILSNGNVGVGNTSPGYLLVVGNSGSPAYCNGTTWQNGSDRDSKEAFAAINPRAVLEKVLALPITEWKYKVETDGTRHLGPVAQDFHAAFGLNGPDDKHIATVDEEGVALAAIQGLNQKLNEKDVEIQDLKARLEKLEQLLIAKNGGTQ